MATKTTNYNLIKPAYEDSADIQVINGNMDVLDTQLKSISDKADTNSKNAYTDVSVTDDYTWKFTKGSGANVSYDKIKKATVADGITYTTNYKPNTDSTKYSQLQYNFGTIPKMGSSTVTLDCGTLKFNHDGSAPWNTALSVPKNSGNRPFISYQNGTAGTDYTDYKELAFKSDADAKLDKTGGNLTGELYTSGDIYKSSDNSVLVLGGSTDASHGARIRLSGEKQNGTINLTADNGTSSNVMNINPNGSYTFNGVPINFGKPNDVDYMMIGSVVKGNIGLALNAQSNSIYFSPNTVESWLRVPYFILEPVQYGSDWYTENYGYFKTDTGLLIQWGVAVNTAHTPAYSNITLPQPYGNQKYTILVTHRHIDYLGNQHNGDNWNIADVVDGQTIRVGCDNNMYVQWMTIGKVD